MDRTLIRVAGGVSAIAAASVAFAAVIHPRLATWGATAAEAAETLPGDEFVPGPATSTTRAISIEADASEVWPWLVQVGTDRGGWYSYDRLERLAGVPVVSTNSIEARWQALEVGDVVTLAPVGWMGLTEGFVMPVALVLPGASLVLRQEPPRSPWDGVWSFHVRPDRGGCRLLIRSRTAKPAGAAAVFAGVAGAVIGEPVTLIMERGMLHGIKCRAEAPQR